MKKVLAILFALFLVFTFIFIDDHNSEIRKEKKKSDITVKKEEKEKEISLVAVGDCLIHGALYMDARVSGDTYDFSSMVSDIGPLIKNYDLKFFNQESIIGGKNLGVSHYPRFNSPDEIGDAMVDIGFNMVSLANNHSLDMGEEGILYSTNYWKEKGIIKSGTNLSLEDRNKVNIYEESGVKFGYLAYTTVTNGLSTPKGKEYLLNVYDKEKVKEDINNLKEKADIIIVSMHWGEEYTHIPVKEEEEIAAYLSDLGVNLIIGTHPHVIQPVKYVGDTLVIYSLGNFISGQKPLGLDKIIGLMVGMNISIKGQKVSFKDIDYKLLYTYSASGDRDYKVIPFENLNDNILKDYKKIEEEYLTIVKDGN